MEDIWTLPIDPSDADNPKAGTAEPFLQTPGTETHIAFSPDGHWAAYSSNDSGAWEAYVRPFPGPGGSISERTRSIRSCWAERDCGDQKQMAAAAPARAVAAAMRSGVLT